MTSASGPDRITSRTDSWAMCSRISPSACSGPANRSSISFRTRSAPVSLCFHTGVLLIDLSALSGTTPVAVTPRMRRHRGAGRTRRSTARLGEALAERPPSRTRPVTSVRTFVAPRTSHTAPATGSPETRSIHSRVGDRNAPSRAWRPGQLLDAGGRVTRKVAPCPGPGELAMMSPPCARAMPRAMVRPSPRPAEPSMSVPR